MSSTERQRAKDLFLAAIDLEPEEREAFLRRECDDEEIRAAARSLLAASEHAGTYLGQVQQGMKAAAADAGSEGARRMDDLTGRRVGPYRLESLVGRGGMGSVYRAERVDGLFGQRVAIKLLSLGAMNEEGHRRFTAEREILARLQHPNIAALYDGGVAEDGTPYFVMEYVEGAAIDAYCEERGLDVPQRLELFLQVCDAVAAAHRNAVVHRDIKPHNVLVADGRVKLLDFGIAKLLEEDEAGGRTQTAAGQALMTPAYASPEQVVGGEITPATDVYALGVLLYELLTGMLPYETADDSNIGVASAICNAPVTKPSARLARSKSEQRSTSLQRRLRGDLDTITLQALRKEPQQRYASVATFAEDIRRHLDGFPVRARRENPLYRASRFARRHRVAVTTLGISIVAVAVLVVLSLDLASSNTEKSEVIAHERGRAGDLLTQLTELYARADPYESRHADAASRALLDAAVEQLRDKPAGDPRTQAQLLFAAGRVYGRLGLEEQARPLLEEAVRLRRALVSGPDEDLAAALYELGAGYGRSGEATAAIELLSEALELERALHPGDHVHVAQVLFARSSSYHDAGLSGGGEGFQEAVRIYRALETEPTQDYAEAMMALGDFLAVSGGIQEATELFEEANAILAERVGQHPALARSLDGLGLLYYNSGRQEEGAACLREAVEVNRAVYGDAGHPALAANLLNLGAVLAAMGDEQGIALLEEGVEMHRSLPSTSAATLGYALTSLGHALRRVDTAAAIDVYEEALDVYAEGDVGPMYVMGTQGALASLLKQQPESERTLELLGEIAATCEAAFGADHARTQAARAEWRAAGGE